MLAMAPAKKKAAAKIGRPTVENAMKRVISFRCSEAFGEWFDSLCEAKRLTSPIVIEHALVEWAEAQGFKPEAPKR